MEWQYKECTNVVNKLQFLTPGCGLIEIEFDINSKPQIRALDGAPYFVGVPDAAELLEKIQEEYPNGFHSRIDLGIKWLRERLRDLAMQHSVTIKSVEEFGCLMVDGKNYDAYKVEVEHANINSPIYIAMTSCNEEFVVFRPYIQFAEFGSQENTKAFVAESEPNISEPEKTIYFRDEIVSAKTYRYSYKGEKLKGETYGFKNNNYGFIYESKFGKFMASGGATHLV